jgi:glycine cleavage system aminomethyltransferase T
MKLNTEFEEGYKAIRNSVALEEESELRCLQLIGTGAFEVLDLICPCDIYLYNGQIKHTLLLNERGIPFADIYACRDGDNAYILGYGPDSKYIIKWIKEHTRSISDYSITDLMESHSTLTLNGPYAWELCAEVVGSEILGLPYLSMISLNNVLVFRAGMTGEYGYHLIIPKENKESCLSTLLDKGSEYDIEIIDTQVRLQCSLENFFFDISREGRYDLNPIELQLQWRLSRHKTEYPGAHSINQIRKRGWNQRLTCFIAKETIKTDEEILCEGEYVGNVLSVGYSPLRKEYVGKALIRRPYWHAGLNCFYVGGRSITTVSAPTINNLSIIISPYIDSYFNRKEDLE